MKQFFPWNVAGTAATLIARGTPGGLRAPDSQLAQLVYFFSNLQHPGDPTDEDFGLNVIARLVYQQWPYQRLSLKTWARTSALFLGTAFEPGYRPEVMTVGWDTDLFGAPIEQAVSIGFCLYAAAANGGRYPLIWDSTAEDVLEMLGGRTNFDEIVHGNFTTDFDQFKRSRRESVEAISASPAEKYKHEPFAFNPLVSRPLVSGVVDDAWIAPCVSAIELKCSTPGIYLAGTERWGTAFSRDLGHLFEQYVGRHLALLERAIVMPEITYRDGPDEVKSIDWIVVTAEFVLLIECKSTMPSPGIQAVAGDQGRAHVARFAKGIGQLNRSSDATFRFREAFANVPTDRPVMGLLVTLGDYDLANDARIRSQLPASSIPTAIVGVETIEDLVTLNAGELAGLFARGFALASETNAIDSRVWLAEAAFRGNPILESAYDALPVVARLSGQIDPSD